MEVNAIMSDPRIALLQSKHNREQPKDVSVPLETKISMHVPRVQ
jgi:hypothetical protein